MSQSQTRTSRTGRPAGVPAQLRSPRAKLVYLFLSTEGTATIEELQRGLGMQKLALYSILKTLREREFVEATDERYRLA